MNEICHEFHFLVNNMQRHRFPFDSKAIPLNGIYVLFEDCEIAHGGSRVVRVGTHTGKNQLCSRLEQHFVKENKDRSIFRKNIGRALLNRDHDPFINQWELDLTTHDARVKHAGSVDIEKQRIVERKVTEYIQTHFQFVVFHVSDKEERLRLESRMISTVSWCKECKPSATWLGLSSPKDKIREGGLWIVNELYKQPMSQTDLQRLQTLARQ
jgi:hypothetical protein